MNILIDNSEHVNLINRQVLRLNYILTQKYNNISSLFGIHNVTYKR